MRRKPLLLALTLAACLPLALIAHTHWRDARDRHHLAVTCLSDKLHSLAAACESAARQNDGHFPDKSEIISHLDPNSCDWLLTCAGSDHPFVWNDRLPTLTLTDPGPIPLIWCPTPSHGRHTGVVLLENAHLRPTSLTHAQLTHLLQQPPPATAPR